MFIADDGQETLRVRKGVYGSLRTTRRIWQRVAHVQGSPLTQQWPVGLQSDVPWCYFSQQRHAILCITSPGSQIILQSTFPRRAVKCPGCLRITFCKQNSTSRGRHWHPVTVYGYIENEESTRGTRYASIYATSRATDGLQRRGLPVLFIPGNAGSSRQVRSIASSAARQHQQERALGKPLDFFTGS
jgi:PGAP1-like protein